MLAARVRAAGRPWVLVGAVVMLLVVLHLTDAVAPQCGAADVAAMLWGGLRLRCGAVAACRLFREIGEKNPGARGLIAVLGEVLLHDVGDILDEVGDRLG